YAVRATWLSHSSHAYRKLPTHDHSRVTLARAKEKSAQATSSNFRPRSTLAALAFEEDFMAGNNFANLRVLSLESRRSREMSQLIANNGGQPTVVASTREVPSGPNDEESAFAAGLLEGQFPVVIFMTGV